MMKMNTKILGTIALLAVFVLVLASAGSVMAMEITPVPNKSDNSNEILLQNSLKHYVMALEAYNSGNYGKVRGQLQAAASNAKHADPYLADLLEQLATPWKHHDIQGLSVGIASQIANTYNHYIVENGWGYTQFDPGNPTAFWKNPPPGTY